MFIHLCCVRFSAYVNKIAYTNVGCRNFDTLVCVADVFVSAFMINKLHKQYYSRQLSNLESFSLNFFNVFIIRSDPIFSFYYSFQRLKNLKVNFFQFKQNEYFFG